MLIFTKAQALIQYLSQSDVSIGFVPTMGALHDGHISLIRQAQACSGITICCIFVNPTQFNNPEDLAKYPRTVERDIRLLDEAECTILFLPDVMDIYPNGMELQKIYSLGSPAEVLEGSFRPGHFQGVAQVVDRLLDIVQPDFLILGQKDLQQISIIQTVINQFHPTVKIIAAPTLRAADGLAQSSRNQRLNLSERALAPIIYQVLIGIQAKKDLAPFSILQKESTDLLEKKGFKVDYLSLINKNTWELMENFDPNVEMAVLIAAFLGDVRLIDNILL